MDAPAAICRCPSCNERFRITEEVLDQAVRNAGGKVRCGACLEVFDARDNLVAEAGAPQALEEPAESWLDAPDRAEQTPTRFAAPYDQPAADEGAPNRSSWAARRTGAHRPRRSIQLRRRAKALGLRPSPPARCACRGVAAPASGHC